MSGDAKKLVGADGRPLIEEPRLIVLKHDKYTRLSPSLPASLSKMMDCDVLVLPMDAEIMMGHIAYEELVSIHHAIHAILEIPDTDFTAEERKTIYSALKFLCDRTHPKDSSPEVALMRKLHSYQS